MVKISGINKVCIRLCLLLIIGLVLSFGLVSAAGISVTKAVLNYQGVLRGGYAEDNIIVATDVPFDVPLSYELTGDINDWITITPDPNNSTVVVSVSEGKILNVIVFPMLFLSRLIFCTRNGE